MKLAVALLFACLVAKTALATIVQSHEVDDRAEEVKKADEKESDQKTEPVAVKPVVEHKPERPVFQIPSIPSFPIFPQIHFPQIHFPAIPIPQLPELPSLPALPSLPRPFKRETIRATKTVFIEKTKKVTRHAVCVTALPGKLRPCAYNHGYHRDDELSAGSEQIEPTSVAAEIQPTRILGDVTYSEPIDLAEADSLAPSVENEPIEPTGGRRQGRYIVRHPIPKLHAQVTFEATEPLNSVPDSLRIDALEESEGHFKPGILKATHYITKTLWVTKIEDVIDHRVTATLLAKNCIPNESIIPRCSKWKDESPLEEDKAAEIETASDSSK